MYRNSEHYASPTEGEALRHIIREEKKKAEQERLDNLPMKLAWENPEKQRERKKKESK